MKPDLSTESRRRCIREAGEAKHSPGPWRLHGGYKTLVVDNEHELVVDATDYNIHIGEAVANAHLIAAAPDMLEMLKEASEYLSGFPSIRELAFNVIAKAEGTNES